MPFDSQNIGKSKSLTEPRVEENMEKNRALIHWWWAYEAVPQVRDQNSNSKGSMPNNIIIPILGT